MDFINLALKKFEGIKTHRVESIVFVLFNEMMQILEIPVKRRCWMNGNPNFNTSCISHLLILGVKYISLFLY